MGGCTGGPVYQNPPSLFQNAADNDYILDQEDFNNTSTNPLDLDDYKKNKKRMQNKESAIRSRMKKKAFYDTLETQVSHLQ